MLCKRRSLLCGAALVVAATALLVVNSPSIQAGGMMGGGMMGGDWGWGMGGGMGGFGGFGTLLLALVVLGIAVLAFRRRNT